MIFNVNGQISGWRKGNASPYRNHACQKKFRKSQQIFVNFERRSIYKEQHWKCLGKRSASLANICGSYPGNLHICNLKKGGATERLHCCESFWTCSQLNRSLVLMFIRAESRILVCPFPKRSWGSHDARLIDTKKIAQFLKIRKCCVSGRPGCRQSLCKKNQIQKFDIYETVI